MSTLTEPRVVETTHTRIDRWWAVAVASVVIGAALASIFAPDVVTGSEQEHLPLAALVDWVWAAIAIGYVSFVGRHRSDASFALGVALLWGAVAATSIFAPAFVTGTDPTQIPLAALIAPVIGTMATAFLALHAVRNAGTLDQRSELRPTEPL